MMNKILKILQLIKNLLLILIGIFLIFSGIFDLKSLSGIMFLLLGIVALPLKFTRNLINRLKINKILMIIVWIILFLIAFSMTISLETNNDGNTSLSEDINIDIEQKSSQNQSEEMQSDNNAFVLMDEYLEAKEYLNSKIGIDTTDMENEEFKDALLYLYLEAKILLEKEYSDELPSTIEDMRNFVVGYIENIETAKDYEVLNEWFHWFLRYEHLQIHSEEIIGDTSRLAIVEDTFYKLIDKPNPYSFETEIQTDGDNVVAISDDYIEDAFQVPIDQIINDNNKEWYNYFSLLNHEISCKNNDDGTSSYTDVISMYSNIVNPYGYYELGKEFRRMYWYWDVYNWQPNLEVVDNWYLDVSGFIDTYWKLEVTSEDEQYSLIHLFDLENDPYDDTSTICIHLGTLYEPYPDKYRNEFELFLAMDDGEIALKNSKDFVVMQLELKPFKSYNGYPTVISSDLGGVSFELYAPKTYASARFSFAPDISIKNGALENPYEPGGKLQPITAEEYYQFVNGNN